MKIISNTDSLSRYCAELAGAEFITVDTEFIRETTYWPRLCLIQLADTNQAAIVDVLADGLSLDPFFDLMRDEAITKVFHAARQDIEIVYHLGGFIPHPVFDTQVAAMVCGFGDSISYDQLVNKVTGERIDKTHRFTDWARRPLTNKQLNYALADVTHLREVYLFLKANLEEQNRAHWVREEMEVLTSVDTYRMDPENAWKRMKMRVRKPRELAVMREVAAWREKEAQRRDMPRNRVFKDDAIYEVAMHRPVDADALALLRAVPRGFERSRAAAGLLSAVKSGLAIPDDALPRLPKGRPAPDGSGAAVDLLKVLLKLTSEANGVAAKVIATVDDLEKIASDDNADVPALHGWRRELFGENALALKHGRIALGFNGRRVVPISHTIEKVPPKAVPSKRRRGKRAASG